MIDISQSLHLYPNLIQSKILTLILTLNPNPNPNLNPKALILIVTQILPEKILFFGCTQSSKGSQGMLVERDMLKLYQSCFRWSYPL